MTARIFPADFIVLLSTCMEMKELAVPTLLSKDIFHAFATRKCFTSSLNGISWLSEATSENTFELRTHAFTSFSMYQWGEVCTSGTSGSQNPGLCTVCCADVRLLD